MKKYIMECFGTMFLALSVIVFGNPIGVGAMFAVLVYLGWNISGSNYNPALSFAIWLRGKLSTMDLLWYVIAQLLGGLFAALLVWFLAGRKYCPQFPQGLDIWKYLVVEILFTMFLCLVIMAVAFTKKLKDNPCNGIIIGLTLMAISFVPGSYNPAITIFPTLCAYDAGAIFYPNLAIYFFGPMIGGTIAAVVYKFLYED